MPPLLDAGFFTFAMHFGFGSVYGLAVGDSLRVCFILWLKFSSRHMEYSEAN